MFKRSAQITIVFLVACSILWWDLDKGSSSAPPALSADERPVFVLAFVPVHWSGTREAFESAAHEQANLFLQESNIEAYARVEVVLMEENFTAAGLDSEWLVQRLVAHGLLRQAADRYVGLTDGDLAPFGDRQIVGWTLGPAALGAVAEVSDDVVTAHELGHTFALCDEYLYEEWSRQDAEWDCPNPYPASCAQEAGLWCKGQPAPDGRHSIMGPAGLRGAYAYNQPGYEHLQGHFAELFTFDGPATATPTPTATPAPVQHAAWAYMDENLMLLTPDGTRETLVPGPVWHLNWSANGQDLAFAAAYSGTLDIYAVSPGLRAQQLVGGPAREFHPVWRPSSTGAETSLLFVSDRHGPLRLYRLSLATSKVATVQGLPAPCSWPAVSPDGGQLAFSCMVGKTWQIGVGKLNADGNVLADTIRWLSVANTTAIMPAWDKSGRRLSWAQAGNDGVLQVYLLDLSTGRKQRLSNGKPAWRPLWLENDVLAWQENDASSVRLIGADRVTGSRWSLPQLEGASWPVPRPGGR